MVTLYRQKLSGLGSTVAAVAAADLTALADDVAAGRERLAYAVGSGGSLVSVEFFRLCRNADRAAPTIAATPLELIADMPAAGSHIWLFSGGADNPDIEAAWRTAMASAATMVVLVTTNRDGAVAHLAAAAADSRARLHILPVSDPKDGFLATHSVAATMAASLLASSQRPARAHFAGSLQECVGASLEIGEDDRAFSEAFEPEDTVLALYDPHLLPIVRELETSLLEAGICNFQQVDLRNFAHGRHVWLDKRSARTRILALTSADTEPLWSAIDALLPPSVRRRHWRFAAAGPWDNFCGVVRAFGLIAALGDAAGIDPGRPGVGSFGRGIYEDRSLIGLAGALGPAVRHKRQATRLGRFACPKPLAEIHRERLTHLLTNAFRGVVLDYDGTIVETSRRTEPPAQAILDELVRILDSGLKLGIATGRGGSAGEALRAALPKRHHDHVVMGYYNGSLLVPLAYDIEQSPPDQDSEIAAVAERIQGGNLLREQHRAKFGRLQVTINADDLATADALERLHMQETLLDGLDVRVLRSQHSIDIVRASATKATVVRHVADATGVLVEEVLCVGDSGARTGNDFELLDGRSSVSVQEVCDNPEGSWTLFGETLSGPSALLKLLQALKIEDGIARFDSGLLLDDAAIDEYKRGT